MSNVYLKVTIEGENLTFSKLDFLGLRNLSPSYSWGVPTHEDMFECWNFLL